MKQTYLYRKVALVHLRYYQQFIFLLLLSINSSNVLASDILSQIDKDCGACHALTAPESDLLSERMTRKGPPLYYAGSKYNSHWLKAWLQKPIRIRPGGEFFGNYTVVTDEGDVIDEALLISHPVLNLPTATAFSQQLMTLTDGRGLSTSYEYRAKKISAKMGAMNFGKFKGCRACHQDEDGYGGVSGPELHSVFARLQPGFIASYIQDPQAWEPYSLMPNKKLKEKDIQKLMDYFNLLGNAP